MVSLSCILSKSGNRRIHSIGAIRGESVQRKLLDNLGFSENKTK